jgi:3-oxoacyl-[acyl-carrier protein] reductase
LSSRIAIVTGGAGSLGLAISSCLVEAGFKVIVFDNNLDNLDRLSNIFDSFKLDVTNYEEVSNAISQIQNRYGKIDVLINNAGVIYSEPLINIFNPLEMKHSYDSFKNNLNSNLNSVFVMSSNVAELMVKKRVKGVIINISSIASCGNAGQTAYAAAKAGVNAMTRTWAKELGPLGIRVASISPGFIDTHSTAEALNDKIIKHLKKNTPLKRLGSRENIALAVLHIIENDFITGTVLEVDGGLVI